MPDATVQRGQANVFALMTPGSGAGNQHMVNDSLFTPIGWARVIKSTKTSLLFIQQCGIARGN